MPQCPTAGYATGIGYIIGIESFRFFVDVRFICRTSK